MTSRSNTLVMIVDDDADIRESLQEVLESQGYATLPMESGSAALEALRQPGIRPKVMLVDFLMPGMKGPELIVQARPYLDSTGARAVLMSADGEWIDGEKGKRCPADERISKPFDFDQLLQVVERLAG